MNSHPPDFSEKNVNIDVYRVLVAGMIASTALFLLGMVVALWHPHTFPLDPAWLRSHYRFGALMHGLRTLDPTAIMLAATAVLILTPVARVAVSLWAFAADRDRQYVFITALVLFVIGLTCVLGLLGLQ